MFKEKRISRSEIYKGKIFNVYKDEVELCNGNIVIREKVEHYGGVCVIVKNKEGKFLFVEQFRYGVNSQTLELIAGKLGKDENPEQCAIREAEEEAGIKAKKVLYLGSIYPTPAYDSEIIHCYFICEYEKVGCKPDENEFLEVRALSEDEVIGKIMNNEINDAKTVTFFLKYLINEKNKI